MISDVVRVGVTNNFSCTDKEWKQIDTFAKENPNKYFFINSNIRTPKLPSVTKHPYKVVVTANPDLVLTQAEFKKVKDKIDLIKSKIAFVRVKYIPNDKQIFALIGALLKRNIPVVLTLQRFNGKATLLKYTDLSFYKFSCSRYRLNGQELKYILKIVDDFNKQGFKIWVCDRKGEGCEGCGLCSKLTIGQDLKISSLNLSTSGVCPYNCPDCYAKTMQRFSKAMGNKPIIYDAIRQNEKQAGRLEHIKAHRKAA